MIELNLKINRKQTILDARMYASGLHKNISKSKLRRFNKSIFTPTELSYYLSTKHF